MSEWCANCHSGLLNPSGTTTTHRHPAGAGALLTLVGENTNYNAYLGSGDLSGSSSSSYNSLAPYEEGSASSWATLASHATNTPGAYGTGPAGGTENVLCLSCHRAHASAFPEMTRFDVTSQYMTMDGVYVGTDNWSSGTIADTGTSARIAGTLGYTTTQLQAAYYDRTPATFATFQRDLCNKCHAKD
jgi:predicted CXXCH cytochrome family protein